MTDATLHELLYTVRVAAVALAAAWALRRLPSVRIRVRRPAAETIAAIAGVALGLGVIVLMLCLVPPQPR